MLAFARRLSTIAFLILLASLLLQAQDQCSTAPPAQFEVTARSGSPVPVTSGFSYTLKNDSDVLIRLKDINPFANKCSASTSTNAYKETAVASFLGIIGGVANVQPAGAPAISQANGANVMKSGIPVRTLPSLGPPGSCAPASDYLNGGAHQEVLRLEALRTSINAAFATTKQNQDAMLTDFNDHLHGLVELQSNAVCTDIVARAQDLMSRPLFDVAPAAALPSLPLDQAIDQVAIQAQSLVGHLADGVSDACKQQARQSIDEDSAFLSALVVGTTAAPSAVEKWRSQLKAFAGVRATITNAQNSIAAILSSRQNFTIDTSIHGNQQVVTYNASCSSIAPRTIAAPDPVAASSTTPAPPTTPPATGGGATPAPAANSWSHDFRFGPGPRFVLAGGLVISPLQQVTFSTTATPGGSGATANTIIQQQNSGTRILPIAMLHARYWDQLPPKGWYAWIPNYLSVGVTAKSSDNKGTNIEYLFGPSWTFADRQFFITAGAYAGQQQRLANSLTVGSTTGLSSANLPITQTTIWKPGFAITWAPAGK